MNELLMIAVEKRKKEKNVKINHYKKILNEAWNKNEMKISPQRRTQQNVVE